MKRLLVFCLLAVLLVASILKLRDGLGGPSLTEINNAIHERLSQSVTLSDIKVKRTPGFVLSADQRIVYTASALLNDDYVQQLAPFTWQEKCNGGREGRGVDADLAGTAVYEVIASKGDVLTLVGRMKAFKDDGQWKFTARSRRLMNNDARISGTPLSAIPDALLTQSARFTQLCTSVFID